MNTLVNLQSASRSPSSQNSSARTVLDASLELTGLVKKTLAEQFPDEEMRDESQFVLRGALMRIDALAQVMFSAACSPDAALKADLLTAYGRHHAFTPTLIDEPQQDETTGEPA